MKIKSVVIDTLTGLMEQEYAEAGRRKIIDRVKWKDWALDVVHLVDFLRNEGFVCVIIAGYPGSGKSYGMKTLPEGSNVWYNCDKKNPTWQGGKAVYGSINTPTKFHVLPKSYDEIMNHVKALKSKDVFDAEPIAFLIGHIEDFKTKDGQIRQRFKTLGNLTNKLDIEAKMTEVLYSEIIMDDNDTRQYLFRTVAQPTDSCRSSEGMFPTEYISNDFRVVIECINNY